MKGSFFSGQQYGKLGETISYRSRGKQVTRIYNSRPANPQSFGQAQQRMIFATAGVAMRSMRKIVDHSFEGTNYGADSLTKFMSLNLKALRANLGDSDKCVFNIKGVNNVQAAPYIVSRGSLPAIGGLLADEGAGVTLRTSFEGFISTQDQYEQYLATLGFKPGDQLTLVGITDDHSSADNIVYENGSNAYRNTGTSTFIYGSLIFPLVFQGSRIGPDQLTEFCEQYGKVEGAPLLMEALADRTGKSGYAFEFDNTATLAAGAIIRSAQQDGRWLRSSEVLDVFPEFIATLNSDDCVASYQASETELTSSMYLNQATSEAVPAVNMSYTPSLPMSETATALYVTLSQKLSLDTIMDHLVVKDVNGNLLPWSKVEISEQTHYFVGGQQNGYQAVSQADSRIMLDPDSSENSPLIGSVEWRG